MPLNKETEPNQYLGEGAEEIRNQWENRDLSDKNIADIDQNTQKSTGDLRGFAVTLIPVKDHLLKLVKQSVK